jgi:hypothetical protein
MPPGTSIHMFQDPLELAVQVPNLATGPTIISSLDSLSRGFDAIRPGVSSAIEWVNCALDQVPAIEELVAFAVVYTDPRLGRVGFSPTISVLTDLLREEANAALLDRVRDLLADTKTGRRSWRQRVGRGLRKHRTRRNACVYVAGPRGDETRRDRDWQPIAVQSAYCARCGYVSLECPHGFEISPRCPDCGRAQDANGHCRSFDEPPSLQVLLALAVAGLVAQRRRPVAFCSTENCIRLVSAKRRGPKTLLCGPCAKIARQRKHRLRGKNGIPLDRYGRRSHEGKGGPRPNSALRGADVTPGKRR